MSASSYVDVAIRSDQDWAGALIIAVGILVILGIGAYWERRDQVQLVEVPDDLPILDHTTCAHDGCGVVLCFCNTLHPKTGQPVTCPGADKPACHHSLVSMATTGGHCATHQRSCMDCIAEDTAMWGSVS